MHEESRIFGKIDRLEQEITNLLKNKKGNREYIIQQCKNLFAKTSEIMHCSHNKLGRKHYTNGFPASPKLVNTANKIFQTKIKIRKEQLKQDRNIDKLQELYEEQKLNYANLREVQSRAVEY